MPQRELVLRRALADLPLPVHDHSYRTDTFYPHWDHIQLVSVTVVPSNPQQSRSRFTVL